MGRLGERQGPPRDRPADWELKPVLHLPNRTVLLRGSVVAVGLFCQWKKDE